MRFAKLAILSAACAFAGAACAQQATVNGVQQKIRLSGGTGVMGQTAVGDFHVGHLDGFKGAHRVAISVFNVAFPDENRFSANMHNRGGGFSFSAKSTMHTTIDGVDRATRQRIADAAYADFVAELKTAGFDVVGPDELARLAPEYATWTAQPNFAQGRFGTYVAPTGRQVYFLTADTARRDTSGQLGQMATMFRAVDRPQAFTRSAYLAHDADIGIIAVTLVVDYGMYSSSGESRKVRAGSSTGFVPGATVQSGSLLDTGTIIDYWRPASGGFPAQAALVVPVYTPEPIGEIVDGNGDIDYAVHADPAKFEAAARSVANQAGGKMVALIAGAR